MGFRNIKMNKDIFFSKEEKKNCKQQIVLYQTEHINGIVKRTKK